MRRRGDERLSQLYSAHASSAAKLALLLTGDEQAAQDITQEAFVRVGGRLGSLRNPDRAAGYLYRTVQNLARGHGRSLARERKLSEKIGSQHSPPDSAPGTADDVEELMMTLPLKQRTALFLRYYLDMSEADAAAALDLSVPAMRSLTHRAIAALRRRAGGGRS